MISILQKIKIPLNRDSFLSSDADGLEKMEYMNEFGDRGISSPNIGKKLSKGSSFSGF